MIGRIKKLLEDDPLVFVATVSISGYLAIVALLIIAAKLVHPHP